MLINFPILQELIKTVNGSGVEGSSNKEVSAKNAVYEKKAGPTK